MSKPKRLFSKYTGSELESFQNASNWKRYWSSFIESCPSGSGLEVGAGIGSNYDYLSPKTRHLTLLEPDETFFSTKLSFLAKNNSNLKVINGTLDTLNVDMRFDAIYYIDVLEHIEFDYRELFLASQFLNLNGSIYILVPAHQILFSKFDYSVGHFRRYNVSSISRIIPSNCELVEIRYLDCIGALMSLINKAILKANNVNVRTVNFWDRFLIPLSKFIDRLINYKIGKSLMLEIRLKG